MRTLACSQVEGPRGGAGRTIVLLHGVLGSGRNWRPFARRLVAACPGWRALLVDLRYHGDSREMEGDATLDACARDVARLEEALGLRFDVVAGHSFGGKVALAWLAREESGEPRDVWILDTAPGPGTIAGRGRIARTLEALSGIETPVAAREVVRRALAERGLPASVTGWMTTNLETSPGGGYRWRFDLPRIRELLEDYRRVDAWPVLEKPPDGAAVTFVHGGRSDVLDPAGVRRLERLAAGGTIRLERLPNAGHWLHVDDPDGLLRLFSRAFSSARP